MDKIKYSIISQFVKYGFPGSKQNNVVFVIPLIGSQTIFQLSNHKCNFLKISYLISEM